MRVVNGLEELDSTKPKVALTLGNFDGFHRGHQALLSRVKSLARAAGAQSAVLTFEPHPSRVLRPEQKVPKLLDLQDLVALLNAQNPDVLIIQPFDRKFAELSAHDFLDLLSRHLTVTALVVGYDFAFGKNRSGTFKVLEEWAARHAVELEQLPPVQDDKGVVSSSRIRDLVQRGEVDLAEACLTRPYYIRGRVVKGEGRGGQIGFHTANIEVASDLIPKNGVYVTKLFIGNDAAGLPSVTNVGVKPTFHEKYAVTVECHVLNQNREFLGQAVRLEFLKRLRDELKFQSVHALIEQIGRDVDAAKAFFS